MFVQDYVLNGQIHGPVGEQLSACRFDPGLLRPYFNEKGVACCTVRNGVVFNNAKKQYEPAFLNVPVRNLQDKGVQSQVFNSTSLRKEEWILLDTVVLRAARYRLRAWADLASANTFGGFNGMGKTILEHETMSDPGEALVDMDALSEGRNDAPQFQLQGVPLPITHADFFTSLRQLAISRNTGTPFDTVMAEACARRVGEQIEKTLIGTTTGLTYGGNSTQVGGYGRASTVYGYTNFPARLTSTSFYKPTGLGRSGTGWVAADLIKDVLGAKDALFLNKFYGPFMVYTSNDWDQYLDGDYILTGGNVATQSLRERLKKIEGIQDIRRLDFMFASQLTGVGSQADNLFPFTILFVQMTPDVARAVNGMDITTVQWESRGGMKINFKVMCIQVPQLRADYYGNCGILHATATH